MNPRSPDLHEFEFNGYIISLQVDTYVIYVPMRKKNGDNIDSVASTGLINSSRFYSDIKRHTGATDEDITYFKLKYPFLP